MFPGIRLNWLLKGWHLSSSVDDVKSWIQLTSSITLKLRGYWFSNIDSAMFSPYLFKFEFQLQCTILKFVFLDIVGLSLSNIILYTKHKALIFLLFSVGWCCYFECSLFNIICFRLVRWR